MKIVYKVKDVLGIANTNRSTRAPLNASAPLEGWPERSKPSPSKCAILLYYLSFVMTMMGAVILVRSAFFVEENDKPLALGVGLCMATGGIALLAISSVLSRVEHDKILTYVDTKVDQLRSENFGNGSDHQEAVYLATAEENAT